MNSDDIDHLIHLIYFNALEQPVNEYIDWGLTFLRKQVNFDSAIFVTASFSHPLQVHAIHYHGETGPEMMENYEDFKHDDFFHQAYSTEPRKND